MTTKPAAPQSLVRILCADTHALFSLGVRALVAGEAGLQVIGEVRTTESMLSAIDRLKPDVLLLDLTFDAGRGLESIPRILARKAPPRIVITADAFDSAELRSALVRGARGVLSKDVTPSLLVRCLRRVADGELWISRQKVEHLVDALRNPAAQQALDGDLSDRENTITRAVIKGASNKQIADQLGMGEQTVKNHMRRIFAKLGVANRVELAVKVNGKQATGKTTAAIPA